MIKSSIYLMMGNNVGCIVLEYIIRRLKTRMLHFYDRTEGTTNESENYNFSYLNQFFLLAKMTLNFFSVIYVEVTMLNIVDPKSPDFIGKIDHPRLYVWIYF